jgi:CDGSH-type Zn-finger protein/uncharacterized Fe-S cluster protein YjdI
MTNAVEEVRSDKIVLRFDTGRCVHSRNCVLERPDIIVPGADTDWIRPQAGTPDEVAALAKSCPSGAITFERLDGGKQEEAPLVNSLRVLENGPLAVRADMVINGQHVGYRAALCRCGASKTKPYCDASHEEAGFVASGERETMPSEPLATRGGPLEITPHQNGPYQVMGALEICTGTAQQITRTAEAWLCRCGASADKPFCDGSHERIGFTAD